MVNEIRANEPKYQDYLDIDATMSDFLAFTASDGFFAGEPCLVAMTSLFNVDIYVMSTTSPTYKYQVETPKAVIELAYLNKCHYDLIVPKQTRKINPDGFMQIEGKKDQYKMALPAQSRSQLLSIIDAALTIDEEKPKDSLSITDIEAHLTDEEATFQYLRELELLPEEKECPICENAMHYISQYAGHPDGVFVCKTCEKMMSPRGNTLFAGTKLPLGTFFRLMLSWVLHENYGILLEKYKVSSKTLSHINQLHAHFAMQVLKKHSEKIGGPLTIVEVDEALLHRRKYEKGRLKELGWVLGGIERPLNPDQTPKMFFHLCKTREQSTLERIIQENVRPGSIIITDCLASYNHLHELGYYHYTANHSHNFVDPQTKAHTQHIENQWRHIRKNAFPSTGSTLVDVELYLVSYMYRRRVMNNLRRFLDDVKELTTEDVAKIFTSRKAHYAKKQQAKPKKFSWKRKEREEVRQTTFQMNVQKIADKLVQETRRKEDRQTKLSRIRDTVHPEHNPPRYMTRFQEKKQ